jgi:hypothetical protein
MPSLNCPYIADLLYIYDTRWSHPVSICSVLSSSIVLCRSVERSSIYYSAQILLPRDRLTSATVYRPCCPYPQTHCTPNVMSPSQIDASAVPAVLDASASVRALAESEEWVRGSLCYMDVSSGVGSFSHSLALLSRYGVQCSLHDVINSANRSTVSVTWYTRARTHTRIYTYIYDRTMYLPLMPTTRYWKSNGNKVSYIYEPRCEMEFSHSQSLCWPAHPFPVETCR